ncbi:MAG: recombination protein O N-terminal domain-containing protein [Candidatus Andersenbacteria bacterium]
MASFSTAVVLRRKIVGEADRLLTVFARTMGKQRLVAKGVRRATAAWRRTSSAAASPTSTWSNAAPGRSP